MTTTSQIKDLASQGAVFFVSHSGGKDSQAMYLTIRDLVPHDQIVVVHATLPGCEWDGVIEHIEATISHELHVVEAGKTFEDMVRARMVFPSGQGSPQCTSDLKRWPIQKFCNKWMRDNGKTLAINCLGIRAEESTSRSKQKAWEENKKMSVGGRTVYDWKPIFDFKVELVWSTIKSHGQKGHFAYDLGMSRLSCMFCINSSKSDMQIAAQYAPEKYARYVQMEKEIGFNMKNGSDLETFTGIKATAQPEAPVRKSFSCGKPPKFVQAKLDEMDADEREAAIAKALAA